MYIYMYLRTCVFMRVLYTYVIYICMYLFIIDVINYVFDYSLV